MKKSLRVKRVELVLTEKELETLKKNAEKACLNVSEFIRNRTIYQEVK